MMNKDQEEYRNAFYGEGDKEVADKSNDAEQSNDAAEGDSDTGAVAIVIDPVAAVDDAAEENGLPTSEDIAASQDAPQTDGEMAEEVPESKDTLEEEISPEDIQRQKSWEGRLKKREEELAAREAALSAPKLAEGGEAAPQEVVDDQDIADIQQKLADDFGDEFVQMIMKLAAYEARKMSGSAIDEKLAPINETLNQAIGDVTAAFQSMHFASIADAYEDFQEIIASPEFQQYVESQPEEKKAAAMQVIEAGNARQVIALLNDFKASIEAQGKGDEPVSDEDLDAAEGVRGSAPVTLPQRAPVGDDDEYKSAWASM